TYNRPLGLSDASRLFLFQGCACSRIQLFPAPPALSHPTPPAPATIPIRLCSAWIPRSGLALPPPQTEQPPAPPPLQGASCRFLPRAFRGKLGNWCPLN